MKKTILLLSLLGLTSYMHSQCNLSASIAVTNPRCEAGFGSATVTASGGSGTYSYQWSTNVGGNSIAFAYAGVYTATVTDGTCSIVATGTVVDPPSIMYTYANMGIPCHGGTGSASVSATGGSGTFNYQWSNGSTSQLITGQPVGTYSVTISDTYSCTQSTSFTFVDPPLLTANTSFTSPLCNGGTGTVTVSAAGGTTPYNYSLTALSFAPSFNGVAPGAYTLITKDANACTVSNTFTLTQPAVVSLTAVASPTALCAGSASTLTASGSGGTGAFSYTWNPGGATTFSNVVTPSSNTTYTVNVKDINGCVASKTVAVAVSAIPVVTVASGSVCAGKSFTMSPSGASTYTYSSGSAIVSPAVNTSYTVTGTNAVGCISQQAVVNVTVNSNPTVTVNSATVCAGTSVVITPAGAASYTITGGTFTVTPAANTSYSITGTSASGCVSGTATATVSVNATPTVVVNSATICSGASVVITPTGAVTYSISGNTFTVSPNATVSYSVTGTGTNGCTSHTAIATVSVNVTPTLSVNNMTTCAGTPVVITPNGANTYTVTGNSFTVNPAATTAYTVTGTAANGCAGNSVVSTVVVNAAPVITVNSGSVCSGSAFVIAPNGATMYTVSGNAFTVSPSANTNYTVTGSDANGCISAAVISSLTVNTLPVVTASTSAGTLCAGTAATLTAQGASTYSWTGYAATASLIVTPTTTTVYEVTGTNANGCKGTYMLSQVVDRCTAIHNRNAELAGVNIYPNPNNGQFVVQSAEGVTLEVLNVMGQTVYSSIATGTKTDVSLAHLPNGIYFVKASAASAQRIIKVVKE